MVELVVVLFVVICCVAVPNAVVWMFGVVALLLLGFDVTYLTIDLCLKLRDCDVCFQLSTTNPRAVSLIKATEAGLCIAPTYHHATINQHRHMLSELFEVP
jgi:hypothetical protein